MNQHGLQIGQAFIGRGDHLECGISPKAYRTAVFLLVKWRIIKAETSYDRRGTITTLLNRAIFDALSGTDSGQPTGQPSTEDENEPRGQPNGQSFGPLRANQRANKGPLTKNGKNGKNAEKGIKRKTLSKESPHHSNEWRSFYLEEELEVIDNYNRICVPRGWRPVDNYSEDLQKALEIFGHGPGSLTDLDEFFTRAADERDAGDVRYNTKLGNKLIRIFWANY